MTQENLPSTIDRVRAALRAPAPLDELHRARQEKRFLDAVQSRGTGPKATVRRTPSALVPFAMGAVTATALAAAAWLLGIFSTGAATPIAYGAPEFSIERARPSALEEGFELSVGDGETLRASSFGATVVGEAGAHVRFDRLSAADVRVRVSAGRASFAFHPAVRGEEHLTVMTPHATVHVVGTEFSIDVRADETLVSVTEGVVRVESLGADSAISPSADGGQPVAAGETSRFGLVAAGVAIPNAMGLGAALPAGAPGAALEAPFDESFVEETEAGSDLLATAETLAAAEAGARGGFEATENAEVPVADTAPPVPARDWEAELEAAESALPSAEAMHALEALAESAAPRSVRADALMALADAEVRRGSGSRALLAWSRAAELARGTVRGANALYEHARYLERTGSREAAEAEYGQYLLLYPHGPNATSVRERFEE